MINRKLLILLMLLIIIPIKVDAKNIFEIENIEIVEKEGNAEELNDPTFENDKLSLHIKLKNLGDHIRYLIQIKNKSKKQYNINLDTSMLNEEYIKYNIEYENEKMINPGETKNVYLTITFENDIPIQESINNSGVYVEETTIPIKVNKETEDEEETNNLKNPETFSNLYLFIIILLVVLLIILLMKASTKKRNIIVLLLFAITHLIIPIRIEAIETVEITIESKIEIDKNDTYTIKEGDTYNTFPYISGMKAIDYLNLNVNGQLGGFYIRPYRIGCDYYIYFEYEFDDCMTDTNDYFYCKEHYSGGENYNSYDFLEHIIHSSQDGYYIFYSCCLTGDTEIETQDKKTKKRKKKKLKDITYDDLILVWNFDKGCYEWVEPLWLQVPEEVPYYYELLFDDGTKLKVIGDHKIYNVDLNKFVNCIEGEDFNIGSHTIKSNNEIISLVSKTKIEKKTYAYNIITKYHLNVFANGILTSWKLNNMYNIKDMKYLKDESIEKVNLDKNKIPEELYNDLRLSEIPSNLCGSMEETQNYIYNLIEKIKNKAK